MAKKPIKYTRAEEDLFLYDKKLKFKIRKRWATFTISIFIVSIIFGYLGIIFNISFNLNTLKWFTSTVSQTYGALVALVVAITIFYRSYIQTELNRINKKTAKEEIRALGIMQINIKYVTFEVISTMALLITFSLFVLMLIDSSFTPKGFALNSIFAFLFLYAAYSLYIIFDFVTKTIVGKD